MRESYRRSIYSEYQIIPMYYLLVIYLLLLQFSLESELVNLM